MEKEITLAEKALDAAKVALNNLTDAAWKGKARSVLNPIEHASSNIALAIGHVGKVKERLTPPPAAAAAAK